jgi:hypothetical protein
MRVRIIIEADLESVEGSFTTEVGLAKMTGDLKTSLTDNFAIENEGDDGALYGLRDDGYPGPFVDNVTVTAEVIQ